jgi:hypothetical protein
MDRFAFIAGGSASCPIEPETGSRQRRRRKSRKARVVQRRCVTPNAHSIAATSSGITSITSSRATRARPARSLSTKLTSPPTVMLSRNALMSMCLPISSRARLAAAALNVNSAFPSASFNCRRVFGCRAGLISCMQRRCNSTACFNTQSLSILVDWARSRLAAAIAAATLGYLSNREPVTSAPRRAYPARTAARVAFRSTRYSPAKRSCLGVSF